MTPNKYNIRPIFQQKTSFDHEDPGPFSTRNRVHTYVYKKKEKHIPL